MKIRQARTIRRMPANTRKVAHILNTMQVLIDRLDRLLPVFQSYELDSIALYVSKGATAIKPDYDPALDTDDEFIPGYTTENIQAIAREIDMRQAAIDSGYLPPDEDDENTPAEASQDKHSIAPRGFADYFEGDGPP